MHFKLIKKKINSERGFVLIFAIMAILILTAIGFFALTMISGDLMISSRLTGERKALSAAEAGVHTVYSSYSIPQLLAYSSNSCIQVDSTNDPSTCYTIATATNTYKQAAVGGGGQCTNCSSFIYDTDVTGKDSNYGSSVTISIGLAPPATSSDTNIIAGTQPGE